MSEFRFEEETHSYWLGSRRIPSVTQALNDAGLISDFAKDEWAASKGTVVHKCCALLAQGKLDFGSVDERILGYVLSYQKFLEHTEWIARAVEMQDYDRDLCYAGTFDVDFESGWLFDLKSGAPAKWHSIQTSAYGRLCQTLGDQRHRGTLYLQSDGSMPKLVEHKDRNDWRVFVACLTLWHFKNGKGN